MKTDRLNIIQNTLSSLIIDDEDSSIGYSKTNIDNKYQFEKIDNIDDLFQIFNKDNESIFQCDTINCLSLILANGQEISLHQYSSNTKPAFLKLSTPLLKETDNEILINVKSKSHFRSERLKKWFIYYTDALYPQSDDDKLSIDGYDRCRKIIGTVKKLQYEIESLQAIDYCNNKHLIIKGHEYRGYLPACDQMILAFKYLIMLNYIFSVLNTDKIISVLGYWTSTEIDRHNAVRINYGHYGIDDKRHSNYALPFFKKIN